jgi:hypothetical protein
MAPKAGCTSRGLFADASTTIYTLRDLTYIRQPALE